MAPAVALLFEQRMINGKAITFDTLFAEGGKRRVARTPRLGLPFMLPVPGRSRP